MQEIRVIELSKIKIVLLLLLAVAFVLLGAWLLTIDVQTIENKRRFNSPVLIYGVSIVGVVFFGLCALIAVRKLFNNSPGLVVSSKGILDNSSGISAGIIPWNEVVGIGEYEVQKQKFVSIHVHDPEKYANTGNVFNKMASKANHKVCGTPINISANTLKIDHEELLKTIEEYYRYSQKSHQQSAAREKST